jgi:hypothetical protein
MFDINDKDKIMKLINMRDEDQIIIPLYVQIYNKRYSLLELSEIKTRFTKGCFKVGFGTADALFMKNSFPTRRFSEFNIIDIFTEYDDEKDVTVRYMVFESSDIEDDGSKLIEQVNYYNDMLYEYTWNLVDAYIKKMINMEN